MARKKVIQLGHARDATAARAIYTGPNTQPKLQLTFKLVSGEEYEIELENYILISSFIDDVLSAEEAMYPRRRRR